MSRSEVVARITESGCVAVVRARSSEQLVDVARALADGGIVAVEITMTTPNALEVISRCREAMGDTALIGVGSVLNAATAREAIAAGAQYIISPIFKPEIIDAAHQADLPCLPGAFTPTEILLATDAGADAVKVFPAGHVGPKYLRAVLAPMPHLKLTPTGGVDLDSAADWIAAGAVTLGVGSSLVSKSILAKGNLAELERLARQYVQIVAEARVAMMGC